MKSAIKICDYIADSQCILKSLRMGNNNFMDDSFDILKTGFTKNFSLSKIDISQCKFTRCK